MDETLTVGEGFVVRGVRGCRCSFYKVFELRPTGKAVLSGNNPLGVGNPEKVALHSTNLLDVHPLERIGVSSTLRLEEVLRLLFKVV